jgi:preprotein translocase subunit SecY
MPAGPDSGRPPRGRTFLRLGVTLAAPLAAALLGLIPIPGIDVELARSMGGAFSAATSVVALGILPFITASILVELACLLGRRGRALRVAGRDGRRRMWRAATIVALGIAVIQAIGVSMYLASAGLYPPPGALAHVVAVATLVAGMALLALLAGAASRYGLCNGFSALIAGGAALELLGAGRGLVERCARGDLGPLALLLFAACAAAVGWATVRAARRRPSGFRDPASGALPVAEATATIGALGTFAAFFGIPALDRIAAIFAPERTAWLAAAGLLGVGLAVLFSFLFHQPLRVGALFARLPGAGPIDAEVARAREALLAAARRSSIYVAALLIVGFVAVSASGGALAFDAIGIAIITAVALDVRDEWAARRRADDWVAVWPEHRVYAADAAVVALAAAGIDAVPRAIHHRTLLQLFGPYVPIDLLVRRDRADEAQRILAAFLPAAPAAKA